ncbi:hypothetical protein OIO90_000531 [Microbotryomycetes sp. JL221]|nr:hypothetical protein OIO90_000531 [Microbotryomycetes sp. JL221]
MSRARLFYDPANPVMLRTEDIQRLAPTDVQSASDQIDQNMVVLLQRIEENFARCNSIVIERILPAVTQHGENSQRIYESVKFWKPFFEAAAAQSFADQDSEEHHDGTVDNDSQIDHGGPDQSLSFGGNESQVSQDQSDGDITIGAIQKQQAQPEWAQDVSLGSLQADYDKLGLPTPKITKQPEPRLRLGDLPPDSPDLPVPEWETVHPSTMKGLPSPTPSSVANSSIPLPSSLRVASAMATAPGSTLLQRILTKHTAPSPRPGAGSGNSKLGPTSSTPGHATRFLLDHDVPKGWEGIADLSKTPLSAFGSPMRRRPDSVQPDPLGSIKQPTFGVSPARTTSARDSQAQTASQTNEGRSYLFASPALSRTPAKEAARRMTQDMYHAVMGGGVEESPLEPPSAMKEWTTRQYNFGTTDENFAPTSPSEGKSFRQHLGGDSLSIPSSRQFDRESMSQGADRLQSSLADFGGTTAKIDDLIAGGDHSFAQLVDDGDELGRRFDDHLHLADESYTLDQPEESDGLADSGHVGGGGTDTLEHSYVIDEGVSEDDFALRRIAPPEDTLFGTAAPNQSVRADQSKAGRSGVGGDRSVFEEDTAFGPRAAARDGSQQVDGFRVLGAVDHTLHGGQLLESEPFDASPLQGRYRDM